MRRLSTLLVVVMVLNASCAGMAHHAETVDAAAPDGGGIQVSMAGGLLSLAAVTALKSRRSAGE